MYKRLIILFILMSCSKFEEPLCFKLKYKMSKDEAEKLLSPEAGEFYLYQEGKDFMKYKKDKCVMEFHKQTGWLVEAQYEVFSHVSEGGPDAVPKQ